MNTKKILVPVFAFGLFAAVLFAEPMVSPSWGFRIDLPEEYRYVSGDGKDKFSFRSPAGANFELAVYPPGKRSANPMPQALAADIQKRLRNSGEISNFEYRNRKAVLLELDFPAPQAAGNKGDPPRFSGWGLCLELETRGNGTPLLLALAYGEAGKAELQTLHISALDSIAAMEGDRYAPGPMTEYAYPRGKRIRISPAGLDLEAFVYEHDQEGAQALVDREFEVLKRAAGSTDPQDSPQWKSAWARFYRTIYRDSFSRLREIAFALERHWSVSNAAPGAGSWDLAGKALAWVQNFSYERNLPGSDFVNLVSAAIEGRGDCDSRSMLWAIVLEQANIPAALMVSADYGHAMGLIDIPGPGARFEWDGTRWLVAETTAAVNLGRIEQKMSDPTYWLGVIFQ
ncbi:hypothetical protein FACS1894137_17880 [Spirochaetia bacterium]|nr:hypothetical protein FACS1894137_17880 [Spirochaetia bacterium]